MSTPGAVAGRPAAADRGAEGSSSIGRPPGHGPTAPPSGPSGPAIAGRPAVAGTAPPPPFALPGAHFAVALVFFAAAGVALVANAGLVTRGVVLAPRVVGTVHLLTLGWITTSILAALYQFLPVALERGIASQRAAWLTFALYVPGLAGFVAWNFTGADALLLPSALAMATGILLFALNLGATLVAAQRHDLTWWALAAAALFLSVTVALGLTLALNLRSDLLGSARVGVLATHVYVALVGWVFLVVIGVAERLLPMFLLSRGGTSLPARVALACTVAGSALVALLHHVIPMRFWPTAAGLIVVGAGTWIRHAVGFFRRRVRRRLDAGMALAAAGMLHLGAAVALGLPMSAGYAPFRLVVVQVALLLLGFTLFVAGHHLKIVPFLVWYHRCAVRPGRGGVQRVSELYSGRVAAASAALLVAGALTLVGGIVATTPALSLLGATLFAAGALAQACQLLSLFTWRPA